MNPKILNMNLKLKHECGQRDAQLHALFAVGVPVFLPILPPDVVRECVSGVGELKEVLLRLGVRVEVRVIVPREFAVLALDEFHVVARGNLKNAVWIEYLRRFSRRHDVHQKCYQKPSPDQRVVHCSGERVGV